MIGPRMRVLVVDDSAFARKVVREVLSSDPELEVVAIARDGLDALEKIAEYRPDVVTLDLRMPGLDGIGVLEALKGRPGPPCVVVTTSEERSDLAILALEAGAIDLVHKPTAQATDQLYELSNELVAKVKVAAGARKPIVADVASVAGVASVASEARARPALKAAAGAGPRVVVVGASTGGPQALARLLAELPQDLPVPLAIVLHMPVGYTAALCERLNASSALEVLEAQDGMVLRPGRAVFGRAGMHFKIAGTMDAPRVLLDVLPLDTPHRPAVDVLFASAARVFGRRALGVVLTGMGEDGVRGSRAIHEARGRVITEAESSCVVYGMPRAVAEAGLSDEVVPLEDVTAAIGRALE